MNNLIKDDKKEGILSITICALISYQPIVYFLNMVLNIYVGEKFIYDTLIINIILLILILKSLRIVFKNIKKDILFSALFIMLLYLTSYLFFDLNRKHMLTSISDVMGNPLYVLFVFSFSGYMFTRYINDYNILNKYMKKFSFAVVVLSVISYLILLNKNIEPQYMVFSYNMLIHTLYLSINFLDNKKMITGFVSLVGIILIFVSGARGPVVIFIFTLAIYYLFRKERILTKMIGMFFATIVSAVFYNNFSYIFIKINNLTNILTINSRTIQKILANDFFDSSGRDSILMEQINAITLLGKGMYGDRVVSNTYAHNIIVELLVQYGYILGFLIILLILFIIGNGIMSKNKKINRLSIIFLSTGFLKLFLSGSYLNQEPSFYILLGLGVNAILERRKNKVENFMVSEHNVTEDS